MWSTVLVLGLFGSLLGVTVYLWGLLLHWGARHAKISGVTTGKTLLITVLVWLCQPLVTFGVEALTPDDPWAMLFSGVAEFGLMAFMTCILIAFIYEASFLQAFRAWLPSLLAPAGTVLLVALVIRPYFYEAYTGSTNTMSPTLLGWHWEVPCPSCGATAFGTLPRGQQLDPDHDAPSGELVMCSRELRSRIALAPVTQYYAPDRFLVDKTRSPKRWDIVLFRLPEAPETLYVQRIAGLPGEELTLRGGAVSINGKLPELPEALRGIEYGMTSATLGIDAWGTEDRPVKLGRDEYFVLGDFSSCARDSRFWERGAPGRPAYAVPEAYIEGVVSHIYWPPRRWRTFP